MQGRENNLALIYLAHYSDIPEKLKVLIFWDKYYFLFFLILICFVNTNPKKWSWLVKEFTRAVQGDFCYKSSEVIQDSPFYCSLPNQLFFGGTPTCINILWENNSGRRHRSVLALAFNTDPWTGYRGQVLDKYIIPSYVKYFFFLAPRFSISHGQYQGLWPFLQWNMIGFVYHST